MKVVVALRKLTDSQARQYLAEQSCDIYKSRFDAQEPAIRNLIDGLYGRGIHVEQQSGTLFWFLVDAPLMPEQWLLEASVAVCFSFDWYQQQTAEIRYLKGIAYCDAAASWAKFLPINGLPAQETQQTGNVDWRGVSLEKTVASSVPTKSSETAVDAEIGVEKLVEIDAHIDAKKISFKKKSVIEAANPLDNFNDLDNAIKKNKIGETIESSNLTSVAVKKRGRPRKQPVHQEQIQAAQLSAVTKMAVSPAADSSSMTPRSVGVGDEAPKKRGRPRKVITPVVAAVDPDEEQLDLFV